MFALTIDQHRSRSGRDLVPELLAALSGVRTVLPFERTVGDEVQGLPADAATTLEALLIVLREFEEKGERSLLAEKIKHVLHKKKP